MKRKAHPHEHEAEINLVPYLDIMVNLVMFMLVSMATATLAVVNVNMPELSDGSASAAPDTPPPEEKKDKLTLNVSIGNGGFYVAATGGLLPSEVPQGEKTDDTAPPTIPCKSKAEITKQAGAAEIPCGTPDKYYDYEALTLLMGKIKKAYPEETSFFLAANRTVRFEAIVQSMDATRGPVPCAIVGRPGDKCSMFPDVAFAAIQ